MYISNRDIIPGCVGAMHCCKAPLWGGRLYLGSLDLTPRFAHRPLLLLWLIILKKRISQRADQPIRDTGEIAGGSNAARATTRRRRCALGCSLLDYARTEDRSMPSGPGVTRHFPGGRS